MMDGMMSGRAGAGVAGILYAEDFGELPPRPLQDLPPPELPPPQRVLTQADVDEACIRAVSAAGEAWAQGAEERRTLALEAIGAGLLEARAAADRQQEAVADGIARSMLGMLAALLPDLCRSHGDAEVRALLRRLLPVIGRQGPVVVRVHAGLLPALAADLETLDDELADSVELRAANLREGDVRMSWEDGGLVRDAAAIRAAILDCLGQLGLDPPSPEPTEPTTRSLTHVCAH